MVVYTEPSIYILLKILTYISYKQRTYTVYLGHLSLGTFKNISIHQPPDTSMTKQSQFTLKMKTRPCQLRRKREVDLFQFDLATV